MTNNLALRLHQHRTGCSRFTSEYRINRLVYVEITHQPIAAIRCEKQIEAWTRAKRVALIESVNPAWDDLSEGWKG